MSDVFNKLFETGIISEEVKTQITSAWDSKVKEHRDSVTAELREEFANRYEHDKTNMVEAIAQGTAKLAMCDSGLMTSLDSVIMATGSHLVCHV